MSKLISFFIRSGSNQEVERLFKQEKVKSWRIDEGFIYLEIPDNEDVKLE